MTELQKRIFKDLHELKLYESVAKNGHKYITEVFDRNIFPTDTALNELIAFDEHLSEEGDSTNDILNLLNQKGAPASVAQLGGRYFGFVNGSVIPAGLCAKLLTTFWDQNTAMRVISPIAAKLEAIVEKWFIDLFGLPDYTCTGFVSGTSSANLCGLAAGRYRILKNQSWNIDKQGLNGAPKIRIVTGAHLHSSARKALNILGFGDTNIEYVPVDNQGRIDVDQLPELDARCIIILQAGNVNSGGFDNFKSVCAKARAANSWVHIDGAFGLWAAAVKRLSYLTDGIELAHSWAVDGHKTLNTPYDSGIVMCADKEAIVSALHMSGGYLILSDERDGMFFTPEMSRRGRIFELWATLKYLGKSGINDMILNMHEMAKLFAVRIRNIDGYEVLNDVVFNQVIVSCENDEITDRTIKNIQDDRVCWIGGSTWFGKKVIRVSICSWATNEKDIDLTIESFERSLLQTLEAI